MTLRRTYSVLQRLIVIYLTNVRKEARHVPQEYQDCEVYYSLSYRTRGDTDSRVLECRARPEDLSFVECSADNLQAHG